MGKEEEFEVESCDIDVLKSFIKDQKNALVVVMSDTCGACDYYKKVVDDFQMEDNETPMAMIFLTDNEQCRKLASELGVLSVPTIIAFKKGEEIERTSPSINYQKDMEQLKELSKKIKD
jgi:thiol-disulfide isomerase/thioredoxin